MPDVLVAMQPSGWLRQVCETVASTDGQLLLNMHTTLF